MTELDQRRSPWNEGLNVPSDYLLHQLYLLGCVVHSSRPIEDLGVHALVALREKFQETEIGRILVTVAAAIRNAMDQNPSRAEYWLAEMENSVGTLDESIGTGKAVSLTFREACNKVLHCNTLNFDYETDAIQRGAPINPIVYLYGEHRGKDWKATLNIDAFIDHANEVA